jgi:hypothetical protein
METRGHMNRFLRVITMCYVLLIIPGVLIYGGIRLFTELRGRELFNSFLPVVLILLILYIYYPIRPFRLLGISLRDEAPAGADPDEDSAEAGRTERRESYHVENRRNTQS